MSFTIDQEILLAMLEFLLAGTVIGPVVSQSFLDLMIMLIFICFAVEASRTKSIDYFSLRKPYLFEIGFIGYFVAIIIGFFVLNITDKAAWFRLYKFHWIINFYLLTWALTRYEINFARISKFFCFAFLIPNLYAIISTLYGYNWISGEILENTRLVGIVQSATYHAHGNGLILMFFLIILFFQFEHFNRKFKILSIFSALLMALSIFLTFTRGIWLSLTITTLGFLLIYNRKLFVAGLVAGLVAMSGLYAFSSDFRQRVHHSIQTKSADQERWNLFNVHVKMFQSSPVLGIGYADNLSHTPSTTWEKFGYDPNFINSHAHNQFLNVLATTGLLGFIPFMLFYLWFFVTNFKLIRKFKSENKFEHLVIAMACLATQIEFALANWTDVGFEYTKIRSLILLVWALVFVMWRGNLKVASIRN